MSETSEIKLVHVKRPRFTASDKLAEYVTTFFNPAIVQPRSKFYGSKEAVVDLSKHVDLSFNDEENKADVAFRKLSSRILLDPQINTRLLNDNSLQIAFVPATKSKAQFEMAINTINKIPSLLPEYPEGFRHFIYTNIPTDQLIDPDQFRSRLNSLRKALAETATASLYSVVPFGIVGEKSKRRIPLENK